MLFKYEGKRECLQLTIERAVAKTNLLRGDKIGGEVFRKEIERRGGKWHTMKKWKPG